MAVSSSTSRRSAIIIMLLAGAATAITLGVIGSTHGSDYQPLPTFGFSSTQSLKAWLGSVVLLLVAGQLLTALWMYGKLGGTRSIPGRVYVTHRMIGRAAFLLSLPVAFYCLYSFGFARDVTDPRTLIHSVAGCLFYGTFVSKMITIRSRRLSRWALPVLGGVVFTSFVVAWATSALWWFNTVGLSR
ncbi:MAG: hypothetical protein H0T78_11385 [Longispora sp.]|nr:hypothetical protein [Longispora sp. (in: high G+C Gram-positive bacteria)]